MYYGNVAVPRECSGYRGRMLFYGNSTAQQNATVCENASVFLLYDGTILYIILHSTGQKFSWAVGMLLRYGIINDVLLCRRRLL
jgi:hypothetical protein